jgi:hypothetical protein
MSDSLQYSKVYGEISLPIQTRQYYYRKIYGDPANLGLCLPLFPEGPNYGGAGPKSDRGEGSLMAYTMVEY